MIKQKSYKEKEHENTRGKRRYIERLAETEEADKQIESYKSDPSSEFDELQDREKSSKNE